MSLVLNNWAQSFNDTLTNDIVSFEQLLAYFEKTHFLMVGLK